MREIRGEALKWVARRGLKGAWQRGREPVSPLEAQSWLWNLMWTLGGILKWKTSLRGGYGRLTRAKEAILLWGAGLALMQGKGTVSILLLEVWLILT